MANKKVLLPLVALFSAVGLAACGADGAQGPKGDKGDQGVPGEVGPQGPKGEKGDSGADGADGVDGVDGKDGVDGVNGVDGNDGVTPHIGENGNWFIGDVDTNIKAAGSNGNDGNDGVTPHIGENGNWFIGDVDTNIKAAGSNGNDGNDGVTPHIGENGNWFIGDVDTNIKAVGIDGQDGAKGDQGEQGDKGEKGDKGDAGEDGLTPYIGFNGNWFIGDVDTGIKAAATTSSIDANAYFDVSSYEVVPSGDDIVLKYTDANKNMLYGELDRAVAPQVTTAVFDVDLNDTDFSFIKNGNDYSKGNFTTWSENAGVYSSPSNGNSGVKGVMKFTVTTAGKMVIKVDGKNEKNYDFVQARKNGDLIPELNTISMFESEKAYSITTVIDVEVNDVVQIGWVSDGGHGATVQFITEAPTYVAMFATYGAGLIAPKIIVGGKVNGGLPSVYKENYYFDGWYSNADFAESNRVTDDTELTDNVILHAHLLPLSGAHMLMGTSMGGYFENSSFTNSALSTSLTVDYFGNFKVVFNSSYSSYDISGKFTGYNAETGVFSTDKGYEFIFDANRGVLFVYATTSSSASSSTKLGVFRLGNSTCIDASNIPTKYFDSGKMRLFSLDGKDYYADASTKSVIAGVRFWSYENGYGVSAEGVGTNDNKIVKIYDDSLTTTYATVSATDSSSYGVVDGEYVGRYAIGEDSEVYISHKSGSSTVYAWYAPYSDSQAGWLYSGKLADNVASFSISGKANYTFTLDKSTMTATVVENKSIITIDYGGHMPADAPTSIAVWNDTWFYTSDLPKFDNGVVDDTGAYVFDGWYKDNEFKTSFYSQKAAGDMTLYVKWLAAKVVTVDPANGEDVYTKTVGEGKKVSLNDPTAPEGYYFTGWYNGDEAFDISSTAITDNISLTAHYAVKPAFISNYSRYNIYGNSIISRSGSGSYYIRTDGSYYIGSTSTTLDVDSAYDANAHTLTHNKGTVKAFDADGHFFIFDDTIDNDWYFCASKDGENPATVKQYAVIGSPLTWIFNVSYSNGDNYSFFADKNGNFTPFVTLKNGSGDVISYSDLGTSLGNQAIIQIFNGDSLVVKYGFNGSEYALDDGLSGTYVGIFCGVADTSIVLDGFGNATVGASNGTYVANGSDVAITIDGKVYNVTISSGEFVQVLDGFEGTYSGANGDIVLSGWGTCTVDGVDGTYVIKSDTLISITVDSIESFYTIDKDAFTYVVAEMSPFSGQTYAGTHGDVWGDPETLSLFFDEGAATSGTIQFGSSTFRATFTGAISGDVLTITFTSDVYSSGLVGKTVTFDISTGKLTVSASQATSGTYKVQVGTVLTVK